MHDISLLVSQIESQLKPISNIELSPIIVPDCSLGALYSLCNSTHDNKTPGAVAFYLFWREVTSLFGSMLGRGLRPQVSNHLKEPRPQELERCLKISRRVYTIGVMLGVGALPLLGGGATRCALPLDNFEALSYPFQTAIPADQ